MQNPADVFARATEFHRAGRLAEADALYRLVVQLAPNHADAHALLGAVCQAQGQLDEAILCFQRALHFAPLDADVHHDLAAALCAQGRQVDAIAALETACRFLPQNASLADSLALARASLHDIQAMAAIEQGDLVAAEAHCRAAETLCPRRAVSHLNLGNVLSGLGKCDQAASAYRRAIELDPGALAARRGLGLIDLAQSRWQPAAEHLSAWHIAHPDDAEADYALAVARARSRDFAQALPGFARQVARQPLSAEAHGNLGAALAELGDSRSAEAHLRRAVQLDPGSADAWTPLGDVLKDLNQCGEAAGAYRSAIAIAGDLVDAHLGLGLSLLASGQWLAGWPEYEWRLRDPAAPRPPAGPERRWQGEPLPGATLLIASEQGLGDTLQFVRYAALARQRVGSVVVECAPAVAGLISGCAGVDRVVLRGQPRGDFAAYVPLLSLPAVFGTTLDSVPAEDAYLSPSADRLAAWRDELAAVSGRRIGVAWQGNPAHRQDRRRSFPLAELAPLAQVPGVQLYSLQFGAGREQLALQANWPIIDLADRLGDFAETAAIVSNLDLVVCCDSALAHLAGSLGVPVWVALSFAADWRWLLGRTDTPWYPSMRLFRQRAEGDWGELFCRLADELRGLPNEQPCRPTP